MIYKLGHNIDHMTQEGVYDATLIRFPGWEDVYFSNPEIDDRGRVPDPIEFVGNLDALALTDFPYLNVPFPLMSWKLLTTLLSVAQFEYRAYPTRIYSDRVEHQVRRESDSVRTDREITDPTLYTDRFVIVQLLEYTDVLDTGRTIYAELVGKSYEARRADQTESEWGFVNEDMIERLVLSSPEEQLPGLFQFPQTFSLLCTDRSVSACRAAGTVGLDFVPIPRPLFRGAREIQGGYRLLPTEVLP